MRVVRLCSNYIIEFCFLSTICVLRKIVTATICHHNISSIKRASQISSPRCSVSLMRAVTTPVKEKRTKNIDDMLYELLFLRESV